MPSMGSVGDAYDNAVAESFFATLECELIDRESFRTRSHARMAVFSFIEGFYNPRRRHSTLGDLSPAEFERHHAQHLELALNGPNSDNGSVASSARRAADGLTTRRLSAVGVDLAPAALLSPQNATVSPTDLAQAATNGGRGTNGTPWPLRQVVEEEAR